MNGAARDDVPEIQHEISVLDIKEGQRGVNVNLKELHFIIGNDVLVLEIEGRQ